MRTFDERAGLTERAVVPDRMRSIITSREPAVVDRTGQLAGLTTTRRVGTLNQSRRPSVRPTPANADPHETRLTGYLCTYPGIGKQLE